MGGKVGPPAPPTHSPQIDNYASHHVKRALHSPAPQEQEIDLVNPVILVSEVRCTDGRAAFRVYSRAELDASTALSYLLPTASDAPRFTPPGAPVTCRHGSPTSSESL